MELLLTQTSRWSHLAPGKILKGLESLLWTEEVLQGEGLRIVLLLELPINPDSRKEVSVDYL